MTDGTGSAASFRKNAIESFLHSDDNAILPQQEQVLDVIRRQLQLQPMEDAFAYVKTLQAQCGDLSLICYSDEYYDTLGLPRPDGTQPEADQMSFGTVEFRFEREKR